MNSRFCAANFLVYCIQYQSRNTAHMQETTVHYINNTKNEQTYWRIDIIKVSFVNE